MWVLLLVRIFYRLSDMLAVSGINAWEGYLHTATVKPQGTGVWLASDENALRDHVDLPPLFSRDLRGSFVLWRLGLHRLSS